ncbi:MAG: hydroxymethylglutaryl-CoA reductase (NADPH) [Candidatus Diapherotrites archaeon]|nr:hydroxymethylglutaryl-CoA reductase (NADPH) [Candidatus Diapherotrites archaeon]
MRLREFHSAKERREALEKEANARLENIAAFTFDEETASKKNIENMIGGAQIPVGIAGPLLVKGEHANAEYYIPLATTEGALVASVNRGCAAITKSGGARCVLLADSMTRAPLFVCDSVREAKALTSWVQQHFDEIRERMQEGSRFLKLKTITPFVVGRNVFLRFEATTGDAMGMNMITIGAEQACRLIEEKTGARFLAASGNMCVDKKPAALNIALGRGKSVAAEATLTKDVLEGVLKTSSEAFVEVGWRKALLGSARAGALAFNAHAANMLAAMFIACGQDPAHVVDSCQCITLAERMGDDVHISVTFPVLEVGTVGGGTSLATQRECLQLLGVAGAGDPPGENSQRLAEIVAATVLAGEISLLAALSSHALGTAHKQLGR